MCYLDRCYCASTNCKNECGRQLTPDVLSSAYRMGLLIEQAYFCDENGKLIVPESKL